MGRVRLLVVSIMAMSSLTLGSVPAYAGEWVAFPATWAYCDYYSGYYGSEYWCFLENEQTWTRVNPNWQNAPMGG